MKINIPKPCSENWHAMKEESTGRFCVHCEETVVDFTHMSDNEILNFFSKNPSTHCGRFHKTQVNRDIEHIIPRKNIFFRFNKVAAAVFAVLSFKSASSKDHNRNQNPTTVFDSNSLKRSKVANGDIVVSGNIRDRQGKPLENAKVQIDSVLVATSDQNGHFEFGVKEYDRESHEPANDFLNLYFSYDGMITQVRTYHLAMKSTEYNIELFATYAGYAREEIIQGGIEGFYSQIGDLPSISFKTKASDLCADSKSMLAAISSKLKANPYATIKLIAYPLANKFALSDKRLESIRKYLINEQGITPERISSGREVGVGDPNVIDIIAGGD